MADLLTSDFEGATPFAVWNTLVGDITQDTAIFYEGAASAKFDSTATRPELEKTITGLPKLLVSQFAFFLPTTFPFVDLMVWRLNIGVGGSRFRVTGAYIGSTGLFRMQLLNSSHEEYVACAEGAWHVVTVRVDVNANVWVLDWNFDGTEMSQLTLDAGGPVDGFTDSLEIGNIISGGFANMIHYMDDVKLGDAAEDYESYKGTATTPQTILFPRWVV